MSCKKIVMGSVVLVLSFIVMVSSAMAADTKIAFVNVDELFESYTKTLELNERLDAQIAQKQSERDAYVSEIRVLKDELVLLADESRRKKEREVDRKIKALQEFDVDSRESIQAIRNDFMKEILEELDEKVQDYGAEKKIDYILNGRLVLHAKEEYDITKDLVTAVNKSYKKNKK